MPQCKRDGCREQAQPYGKRLCPKHEAERRARSAAYFAKPKCAYCGTQHTDMLCPSGLPECGSCRNQRLDRSFKQSQKQQVVDELMQCSDLDQLKHFILHHLLKT